MVIIVLNQLKDFNTVNINIYKIYKNLTGLIRLLLFTFLMFKVKKLIKNFQLSFDTLNLIKFTLKH